PWFPKLIERQIWRILPEEMRLEHRRDQYGVSLLRVEQEHRAVQLRKAFRYWSLTQVRQCFFRWDNFSYKRRIKRRGAEHFRIKQLHCGLKALLEHRNRQLWMHTRIEQARQQYHKKLLVTVLLDWVFYWASWQQLYFSATQRSLNGLPSRLLRPTYFAWIKYTQVTKEMKRNRHNICIKKILEARDKLKKRVYEQWKYYVEIQRRNRQASAQQEAMVARSIELARVECEVSQMQFEDELAQHVLLDEKREIERRRAELFKFQTENIKKLRKEREIIAYRTGKKKAHQERIDAANDAAWKEIERTAIAKTRELAKAWLNTAEGKVKLNELATYVYETDPATVVANLKVDPMYANVPNCAWVCRMEVFRNKTTPPKAYYMHLEDLNKILCVNLTMKDCETICREQFIQTKVNKALATLAVKGVEEKLRFLQERSAKTIQMLFRCRQAKKYVRSLQRSVVMRRIDPSTGAVVYFNTMSRETSWTPPRLIGSAENTLPMESLTWVRRMNDEGDMFYINQETLETSWTPPNHFIMCHKCKINFVTQRHVESGERYCVSCFAECIFLEREEAKKKSSARPVPDPRKCWTKVVVQAAKCSVCKTNVAVLLCHECLGDTTCQRCFNALHSNAKLRHHTKQESLVYVQSPKETTPADPRLCNSLEVAVGVLLSLRSLSLFISSDKSIALSSFASQLIFDAISSDPFDLSLVAFEEENDWVIQTRLSVTRRPTALSSFLKFGCQVHTMLRRCVPRIPATAISRLNASQAVVMPKADEPLVVVDNFVPLPEGLAETKAQDAKQNDDRNVDIWAVVFGKPEI
ncbi:hypothetical protein THRCLA_09586, partial [Thraustotheca clavata]